MDITGFLTQHQLPESYRHSAQEWFIPLADEIAVHSNGASHPFFVGVNGCQGSGKSTVCDFLIYYLQHAHQLHAVTVSLDDFYLSKAVRAELASDIHPLLKTRGVPGTHDTALAENTLRSLQHGEPVALPRFNKATDDPFPINSWPVINDQVDVVLVEGWCWGVPAQSDSELEVPVNQLEAQEDPAGTWRQYVNTQLAEFYQPLFDFMQFWIMLKGPSFEHVYRWRCEQEHKLAQKHAGAGIMSDEQILRFIQHYQRLTEQAFATLPDMCDRVFELDENRQITRIIRKDK